MPAKRIYRNQRNKVIGGVCAGIADYFDVDVAWVRLAFVLAVFAKGFGLLAYVIAWIVFPRDERLPAEVDADRARAQTDRGTDTRSRWRTAGSGSRNAVGVILILLGALFFMDQNFWWFRFDSFWPLILIALGVYMLVRSTDAEKSAESESLAAGALAANAASDTTTSGDHRSSSAGDRESGHA
jgi:phage shock protein C